MSIEEAEDILNEAVISEPSTKSYTYISAEEISKAINKMLEERIKEEKKIRELEENSIKEKERLENIIKQKEIEIEKNKSNIFSNIYLKEEFKYIKKVVNPLFLLEN